MSKRRTLLSWSSGKDSAWTLYQLQQQPDIELVGLVTTLNEAFNRVAMHGIRVELLRMQAEAAGLPLWEVPLPWPCSNADYEMRALIERARAERIDCIAFGDLWLADVRAYREKQMAGNGIEPIFPLWSAEHDTPRIAREMVNAGVRATISCMDPRKLPATFAGRTFDAGLLADLPEGLDPCGERGEFHTFCHTGPMFRHSIPIKVGETVERDGFVFTDLLPD